MSKTAAYKRGYADYLAGDESGDNPYSSDRDANDWERGYWDAESREGPQEHVLNARYGTLSERN